MEKKENNIDQHELDKIRMRKMQALMEAKKRNEAAQERVISVSDKIEYLLKIVLAPEAYAHLNNFVKGLEEGDIVETGQIIGYVGSTGYGKEGTSGKFPPHLHFGFYKYDGRKEWSFNPYIYIRRWERVKAKKMTE